MKFFIRKITILLIFAFLLSINFLLAQVVSDRNVIGSTGYSFTGSGIEVDATVGELVVATDENGSAGIILSQGFHQPTSILNIAQMQLIFDESVATKSSCPQAADASAKILLTNGTAPFTYQWTPDVSTTDSASALIAGEYLVFVTDALGRTGTTSVKVEAEASECEFEFFTGITPNGDLVNDQWNIGGIQYFTENNAVRIFNRWGNLVWSANGYDNNSKVFKGKGINNADLPDGTYFYVVDINNKKFKGWIELTR